MTVIYLFCQDYAAEIDVTISTNTWRYKIIKPITIIGSKPFKYNPDKSPKFHYIGTSFEYGTWRIPSLISNCTPSNKLLRKKGKRLHTARDLIIIIRSYIITFEFITIITYYNIGTIIIAVVVSRPYLKPNGDVFAPIRLRNV